MKEAPMPIPVVDSLLQTLRWRDVVDILLLTVLFASAYRWMRRTVAVQVALGLMTLVVAAWGADRLGLILTSYLLSVVGAAAPILIVVVFQNEIRHALTRVNPLRWLGRQPGKTGPTDPCLTIARAAFTIAGHKKGALIVIPRQDTLAEQVTYGIPVDARLSPSVIEAIFTSPSPLHDGAVVVDRTHLRRASVILPLATGSEYSNHGTRHRAARGLAQNTDALVVCVSEEHGTVSLAFGENLDPMPDETQLQAALIRLWIRNDHRDRINDGKKGRRWLGLLPYLTIFLAVSLGWAALALDRSHVQARIVPLEFHNLPAGLSVEAIRRSSITLQLSSSRRELELVSPTDVQAYVDLSQAKPGIRTFPVQTKVPAGIEVTNSSPESVELRLRLKSDPDSPAR
jgi:uncharacterized protein (TIGR00159 family)